MNRPVTGCGHRVKAVIPAAGLGTRFLPATKNQPKEMLPVVDKPAIQYVVEECVASGITQILIITGRGKRAIEDHFDRSMELEGALAKAGAEHSLAEVQRIGRMADLHFVRQKEALGLGHAVLCARPYVGDEPFLVLLGDDLVVSATPCLQQLVAAHERVGGSVVAVEHVPRQRLGSYGVVDPGPAVEPNLFPVKGLVEKPAPEDAPSDLGILGRYLLSPSIFEELAATEPGQGGEIQLTDALRRLAAKEAMHALVVDGTRYDVGDKLGWLKANIEFGLAHPELGRDLAAYLDARKG